MTDEPDTMRAGTDDPDRHDTDVPPRTNPAPADRPGPLTRLWRRLAAPVARGYRAGLGWGHGRQHVADGRVLYGTTDCTACGRRERPGQAVPEPSQFTGSDRDPVTGRPLGAIVTVDAPLVRCSCGGVYHAIGCYTTHHAD